ncbi:RNA polymerase iii DNA directed [Anaeramoeba flamelloides]|uniref:RNA polymerase iii DNA directed n=1 Tax=Anaeramoeba flamelloides TaxID=1746091 RepID=A0ABQ8XI69_9EUKA|nr:RNA polymerase iii DNA directed [Anaeramoeba flamelloides]
MNFAEKILQTMTEEFTTIATLEKTLQTDKNTLLGSLNQLLKTGRIRLFQRKDGQKVFQKVSGQSARKMQGLSNQEAFVYRVIKESGSMGILQRDISQKTGLKKTITRKILTRLKKRKLVKTEKSIKFKNQLVYLLFEITPSVEVTGDVFYIDQEWNTEFVELLTDSVLIIIKDLGTANVAQILEELEKRKLVQQSLTSNNLMRVIDSLIYMRIVRRVYSFTKEDVFQIDESPSLSSNMLKVPCGICPKFSDCKIKGSINPISCPYLEQFLDF